MYHLATCRATIYRGTTLNEFGGPKASLMPIKRNVLASIDEWKMRVSDNVSQTPRTVRITEAFFPYGTDVQVNDRVTDDSHGIEYFVVSVQVIRVAAIRPDLVAELRRV